MNSSSTIQDGTWGRCQICDSLFSLFYQYHCRIWSISDTEIRFAGSDYIIWGKRLIIFWGIVNLNYWICSLIRLRARVRKYLCFWSNPSDVGVLMPRIPFFEWDPPLIAQWFIWPNGIRVINSSRRHPKDLYRYTDTRHHRLKFLLFDPIDARKTTAI